MRTTLAVPFLGSHQPWESNREMQLPDSETRWSRVEGESSCREVCPDPVLPASEVARILFAGCQSWGLLQSGSWCWGWEVRGNASRGAEAWGMVWGSDSAAAGFLDPWAALIQGATDPAPVLSPPALTLALGPGPGAALGAPVAMEMWLPWLSRQAICLLQGLCLLLPLSGIPFPQIITGPHQPFRSQFNGTSSESCPSPPSPVPCFIVFTALWLFGSLLFVCGLRAGGKRGWGEG